MDEAYTKNIKRMVGVIGNVEAGNELGNADAKWLVTEFTECVALLNNAIDNAHAHCHMLRNLCIACEDKDQDKIDAAIAEAVAYHAEPDETPAKGGGNGQVLQ